MRISSQGGIPPLSCRHGPLETMLADGGTCKELALAVTVFWGLC